MVRFLFLMACMVGMILPTQAQRLIPKQKGIEVTYSLPIVKGESLFAGNDFGLGLSLTKYLAHENYTFVTAEYERQSLPYRTYRVKMQDVLLHWGYMHPILSDKGRNVLVYSGVSVLAGYEELNEDKTLLPDGATLLDRSRFVYGGAAHLSVECFITDRMLLLVKARGRLLFGSDLHVFRPALSAGLRFHL